MANNQKYADTDVFTRPPELTRLEAFRNFLYNPEKKTFFGRTCINWGQLFVFYVIFYSVLAAFFAVCIWGLLQSLDEERPTYELDASIIGSSPGLASRPMPPEGRDSVLLFNRKNMSWSSVEWPEALNEFLQEYQKPNPDAQTCNYTYRGDLPCAVDIGGWKNCTPSGKKVNGFCIFFKINKVINWVPEYYKDVNSIPSAAPEQLKEAFQNADVKEREKVWISCEGRKETDKANLGNITFYPEQGFPGYYYPFKRQKGFLSPVVAVHFENPALGKEIDVECRTWAPNIVQDRKEQLGVLNYKLKFE